jgi:hypothetical protein
MADQIREQVEDPRADLDQIAAFAELEALGIELELAEGIDRQCDAPYGLAV